MLIWIHTDLKLAARFGRYCPAVCPGGIINEIGLPPGALAYSDELPGGRYPVLNCSNNIGDKI